METLNGKGNDKFIAHSYTEISVVATGDHHVVIDDEIQTPKKLHYANKGQTVEILADESVRHTIRLSTLQSRNEINSGEKLVEIIDDSEISMEDRLRSQMMAELSRLASAKGLDTYEDDNDFHDDFEDDNLSSYEKKEMVEEYLIDNNITTNEMLENKKSAPQVSLKEETSTSNPETSTNEVS